MNVGEFLGMQLVTIHNIAYFMRLIKRIRKAIETDTYEELRKEFA